MRGIIECLRAARSKEYRNAGTETALVTPPVGCVARRPFLLGEVLHSGRLDRDRGIAAVGGSGGIV